MRAGWIAPSGCPINAPAGQPSRLGRVLLLCRPCHKQIHAVLNERELAETYNRRAALLEHAAIAEFVAWIADKPPGFNPRTRRASR